MAKTEKRAGKPAAAEEKTNGATLGFETKLWQAADKMRNNYHRWRGDGDASVGAQFIAPSSRDQKSGRDESRP